MTDSFETVPARADSGPSANREASQPGMAPDLLVRGQRQHFALERMFDLGLDAVISEDLWAEASQRAAATMNFSEENMLAIAEELSRTHYGQSVDRGPALPA